MTTLIIFDIDGTLSDTTYIDGICIVQAFKVLYNLQIDKEKWEEYKLLSTNTDHGLFNVILKNELNKTPSKTDYIDYKKYIIENLEKAFIKKPEYFKEITGAVKTIKHIINTNIAKIGIATGSWRESGLIKLNAIGINYNSFPYSNSDNFQVRSDIINDVIKQSEIKYNIKKFDKIIFFGDGLWDYLASIKLDIEFIGIDYYRTNELKYNGVEKIIHDYSNINQVSNLILEKI